jgi:hypothetical protein
MIRGRERAHRMRVVSVAAYQESVGDEWELYTVCPETVQSQEGGVDDGSTPE